MFLLLAQLAQAACTFDASADQLATNIDAAEKAYVSLDVPEFQRAMTEVDYLLPCLTDTVAPSLAADLHRIRAIGQYVDGKPDAVQASLRAAKGLEPDYVFPTEVLPEGFELRDQYEATPAAAPEAHRLPKPSKGTTLLVDGSPGQARPDRATLLQVSSSSDGVLGTHYLLPGDSLPPYPGVDRRRNALLTGAIVTGGASLAMYGGAWVSYAGLQQAEDQEQLRVGTVRTHALMGGSAALLVGSLAQVGVLALQGRAR